MTPTSTGNGEGASFERAQSALLDHYGTEATSRFVQVEEPPLECHLLEAGEGEPIVILHGGGGMAVQMEPLLGGLSDQFNVIAPDRPGCGLTESFDYSGVNFRKHGVDFLRSLWDVLDIDQASIVASSIAGVWTIGFAIAQPDRVKNIAFVGAPAGLTPKIPLPLRLAGTPIIGTILFRTALGHSRANYRQQLRNYVVDPEKIPPELVDATFASMSTPSARRSFKTMVQEVTTPFGFKSKYVLRDQLQAVEQPTLFIWGSDDPVHPVSAGRRAAEKLSNGSFELIDEAGHYAWLDAPEQIEGLLRNFLE